MERSKFAVYAKFLAYLRPYWVKEILLLVLILIGSAGSLASPYVLKIIIDDVFPNQDYQLLMQVLGILVAVYIVRISAYFAADYLDTWIGSHIMLDIRKELFRHLLTLPLSFFKKNQTGDIVHRINNEVEQIQDALTDSVVRFLNNMFTLLGLMIMLCILNYRLFLISVLIYPFVILTIRYFNPLIRKMYKQIRENEASLLSFFSERFDNIKLIKSFNAYGYEDGRLVAQINKLIGLNLKGTVYSSGTKNITVFLLALSPIIIFGYGGSQVLNGAMSVGALIAFLQYMNRFYKPVRDMMNLYVDLIQTSVSIHRVFEYLDESAPIQTEGKVVEVAPKQTIKFRNVSFAYEGKAVLDSLNATFEVGKSYAIVGASGCGKSTLLSLLCKFYEADDGEILIDDLPLHGINTRAWIDQLNIVHQDSMLFEGTIRENINYSKLTDQEQVIERAAELAGIGTYVKDLPAQFDTQAGEKGARLSGGQKQRIALARALLKKAEVIVLDEATSAVDSENEAKLFQHLKTSFAGKTIFLISHRLSTVREADEIFVMQDGRIVEQGTHAGLVVQKGPYWNLFKHQLTNVHFTSV